MSDNLARFERMAAAAAERKRAQAAAEEAAEERYWARGYADAPRKLAACYADMTLGEGIDIRTGPGWACACSGPPFWPAPPGTPCSCAITMMRVDSLQRGAHIVANLLQQVVERGGPS